MRIEINGQTRDIPANMTILALLDSLGLKPMGIVVERNSQILDQAAFSSTALCEGDRLELVRLVGGG